MGKVKETIIKIWELLGEDCPDTPDLENFNDPAVEELQKSESRIVNFETAVSTKAGKGKSSQKDTIVEKVQVKQPTNAANLNSRQNSEKERGA